MSWTGWPPSTGDDAQSWDFIKQAYEALRERAWATGQEFWPRTNAAWATGTVSDATDTTISDSSADFGGTGAWPFDSSTTGITNWQVVIDAGDNTDPRLIVRAAVSSWTSTTLTIASIADYIAEGIIASASSLVGKKYYLIKSGGVWWDDRWMQWPNDELDHGAASSATTSTLTETGRKWAVDQWAGKDLVTRTAADGVQRVAIVSNTADTLTFATQSWTPSGAYSITDTGSIAIPGRTPGAIYKWYDGATRSFYSHYPDDTLTPTALPALDVTYSTGTGAAACEDHSFDIFDIDWWSGLDEECSTKDKPYAPNLFRTIRGLQLGAENFVASFIDPDRTYGGSSDEIRNFTTAEWFTAAGINSVSVPYSNTSEASQTIYYTTIEPDGTVRESGTKTVAAGASVADSDVGYVAGDSVSASLGWTRKIPREFRMLYDRTVFIPDLDESLDVVDPPVDEAGKAGSWLTRPKSTSYKEHDAYGLVIDGGVAFVEGDVARFAGDNWNDGNVGNTSFTDTDPLMTYWDRQSEVVPAAGIDTAERSGTATSGGTWWLEDTGQDWWEGVLYTHTGTATGGSTSTLIDTAKASSFMWGNTGTQNRFVGFILEITAGANAGLKVPITSYTPATQTIGFDAVTGLDPTGQTYRIREPKYELNRWKDSIVRITKGDGSTVDVTVTHNDDTRLYFAAQAFSMAGLKYQIIRQSPGGCWQRSSGAWAKPSGNDPRTDTAWPDDQSTILPTAATRYGRMMKGDYIQSSLFSELQAGINKLKWTNPTHSWTSRADAGTPESNKNVENWQGGGTNRTDAWANMTKFSTVTSESSEAPQNSYAGSIAPLGPGYTATAGVNAVYAYLQATGLNTNLSCTIDWMAWAGIDSDNHDEVDAGGLYRKFQNWGHDVSFRQWTVFSTTGPANDEDRVSAKLGSNTGQGPGTNPSGANSVLEGYCVLKSAAITKWDMSYV